MIYFALPILLATIAAHESVKLLFILIPYSVWLYFKKEKNWMILCVIILTLSSYSYFSHTLSARTTSIPNEMNITWTDKYTINGQKLRGFAQLSNGQKVYIVCTFQSEQQKDKFKEQPLSGTVFRVTGELVAPEMPAHRYAFSMGKYIDNNGAQGIFEVKSFHYVKKEKSLAAFFAEQRFKVKKHIEETFPDSLVAEAQALIIGERENVDMDVERAYQKLGITHLFAISGLHVALISMLVYELLLRLHIRREHATVVIMIALPIYACVAGGAPSVWRAVSVVELVMISRIVSNRLAIDDALAISFIGFVLLQPSVVFQIGFQLSYLATVSLIFSGKLFSHAKNWWQQSFAITFVCQLLVYPLLLYHFFEISLSSFIANIFFVPVFSFFVLPANLLLLLLTYVASPLARYCFFVYEPARELLSGVIMWLQAIPYQMWTPGRPSIWLLLFAFASVIVVLIQIEQKRHWLLIAVSLLLPVFFIHESPSWHRDLKITFLSVGQGDCAIIELPLRKTVYVIDTGGLLRFNQDAWKESSKPYEVGRRVVVPYLKGSGIRAVDTLILTHADADHVEGAEEVMEEVRVKEIHISPNSWQKSVMQDIVEIAKKERIPIREQMAGKRWVKEDTILTYLSPTDSVYEGNNDSLVLLLQHAGFQALFTGDLEEPGELNLVKNQTQAITNIDILKVGHHGSKTSSSEPFLKLVQPTLSIFSTGLNNRYGHPNKDVVARIQELQLPTLNTAEVGTIEVSITKGGFMVFKTINLSKQKKTSSN
ncbi:DNA internalization-related competence protein ComEC/Rec2 [Viridibacillus sp. YIM B01967]|uniref:DNA internalization-related competence protein ComEC/Rec2 n=1 Tax=Viridibacillus soli TaxID=2798301 RepID=A0ABS1H1R6_9BACL|nr:DNA internalization-related competence protein ComEC/Rec2 [Viridibacillus soli]MBK3493348.1 DNA internalization-related competence protein ComEC/Rec2 [Viridibacillus soli]